MTRIAVLPGDGIGKEVIPAAVKVMKAAGDYEFVYGEIGYECYQKTGASVPDSTLELIKYSDACLFGAVTTPPNIPGYRSPILTLRKKLDLYANLRPMKTYPLPGFRDNVDMVFVRENTEGLYSGRERVEDNGDTAITERVITRKGSERIIRFAFDHARKHGRKKVTCVHKANVLRETCGLFLRIFREIAPKYPDIAAEDVIVDAMAMHLIRAPEEYDVIVTTNLFGDILSDEASMLVGGLGIAASGNIGEHPVFEPVHGSAPNLVGTMTANPIAAILAAKMMLEHLGQVDAASRITQAVNQAMHERMLTTDLGGKLKTEEVAEYIAEKVRISG